MGRSVDFMKEVTLQDDGKGAYIAEWNIKDKTKPTDDELKAKESDADKLEKNRSKFTDTDKQFLQYYDGHIKNLRENKVEESERKHLLESFIKYNDQQDKFRGKTTWRKLIPELETSITKYLSQS